MARYQIPTRNDYGYRTGIYQSFFVSLAVTLALVLFINHFLSPIAYRQYRKERALPAGSVGAAADDSVPVAQSIDDLERLERFTINTVGSVLNYDDFTAEDGTVYHYLTLPSGETIYARINRKALTQLEEAGHYRLPVGCWREWPGEPPGLVTEMANRIANGENAAYYAEKFGEDYPRRAASRYVDMYGDYRPVLSEADYIDNLNHGLVGILTILTFLGYSILRNLLGQTAPIFWASKDRLLPKNDLECWCASTFAIWSFSFPALEGWPLVTGGHRTARRVRMTRRSLREQWGIQGKEDGLNVVRQDLTDSWARETGLLDGTCAGWDLCRATQLLGMMHLAGYIDRATLDVEFSRAGRVIQQRFSGWDALTDSYLLGCAQWLGREYHKRRDILLDLRATPYGPYSIPWRTDLTWAPDGSSGDDTAIREILRNYRVR